MFFVLIVYQLIITTTASRLALSVQSMVWVA
jgi:hypothetical protein